MKQDSDFTVEKQETGFVIRKENMEANSVRPLPEWLEVDREKMSGKVIRLANREDIDLPVEEHLIVELYSK